MSSTSFSLAAITTWRPSGDSSGNGHCSCGGPIGPSTLPLLSTHTICVIREPVPFTWTRVPSAETLGTSPSGATMNGSPVTSCRASENGSAQMPALAG